MQFIVQKFGGTSLANIDQFKKIAKQISKEIEKNNKVAVVVSAMAGFTDYLIDLTKSISIVPNLEEYDVVVSSGEQISSGLLAIALQNLGIAAKSLLSWQVPIITNSIHNRACISKINPERIIESFKKYNVIIISGFQGIDFNGRITTLGRGGSDLTAIAVAASLNASRCDIFTDVDGVYTSDPRVVSKARKLNHITFEEMIEFASHGAKVIQRQAIEMAMRKNVNLQILSSFEDKKGTFIMNKNMIFENNRKIKGIVHNRFTAKITLEGFDSKSNFLSKIFYCLDNAKINTDMVAHNGNRKEKNITIVVSEDNLDRIKNIFLDKKQELSFKNIYYDKNIAKISIIGEGINDHSDVTYRMLEVLSNKNIEVQDISTSGVTINIIISEEYTELAVRALHSAYGLDY